jgi:hypothetical protein
LKFFFLLDIFTCEWSIIIMHCKLHKEGNDVMRNILLSVIVLLALFTACTESPEATPAPEPEPVTTPEPEPTLTSPITAVEPTPESDISEISEEEMAAIIWNRLPSSLPDGYTKSQFISETGKATYIKDGKWEFQLSGSGSNSKSLPQKNYEKTPGQWYVNNSKEITTYSLMLTANYYEETSTLDIQGIRKFDEKTTVETIHEEPVLGKGVKVNNIGGGNVGGFTIHFEGNVTNIGVVPLENVMIEFILFDVKGNLMGTEQTTLTPSKINPGEKATFVLEIEQKPVISEIGEHGEYNLGTYNYRFLLSSGEELYFERPDY